MPCGRFCPLTWSDQNFEATAYSSLQEKRKSHLLVYLLLCFSILFLVCRNDCLLIPNTSFDFFLAHYVVKADAILTLRCSDLFLILWWWIIHCSPSLTSHSFWLSKGCLGSQKAVDWLLLLFIFSLMICLSQSNVHASNWEGKRSQHKGNDKK